MLLSFIFYTVALIYFKYAVVVYTSLNSSVVLCSDFGRISQQILGLQIDHEFGLRILANLLLC
jgi:hypothetical protein